MKKFLLSLVALCAAICVNAQEVTLDFTDPTNPWKLPTDYTKTAGTYTNGEYTISFGEAVTGDGYKLGTYKEVSYLMFGKAKATFNLPVFDFEVSKIEIVGRADASGAVLQNLYVGDVAVSTQTAGAKETNTYLIAPAYQTAGTQYTLKVESAHNSQITAINIYKKEAGAPDAPTFSVEASTYTTPQTVSIFAQEGTTIYYTIDGTEPTTASAVFSEALVFEEPTTVKAIAVRNGIASIVAEAFYSIVYPEGDGTEANPFTVEDVIKLNNCHEGEAWVIGYIRGSYANGSKIADKTAEANIAISSTMESEVLIPVALIPDTEARTVLNVVKHPENIGKQVLVKGTLAAYFDTKGVRETSDYKLVGEDAINSIKANSTKTIIFDLQGRQVKQAGKGLHIVNGKKVQF